MAGSSNTYLCILLSLAMIVQAQETTTKPDIVDGMTCPLTFVGYPLTISLALSLPVEAQAGLGLSSNDTILELYWYKVAASDRTLWVRCHNFECELHQRSGFRVSLTTNNQLLFQLVVVSDMEHSGLWSTEANYLGAFLSFNCNVALGYRDPKSDCLNPIVRTPSGWEIGGYVSVTLMCFTRKIEKIGFRGNYSNVFKVPDYQSSLYDPTTASFEMIIPRQINPLTAFEMMLDITYDQDFKMTVPLILRGNSSAQKPQFSQNVYRGFFRNDTTLGNKVLSVRINHHHQNLQLFMSDFFPGEFRDSFRLKQESKGQYEIVPSENFNLVPMQFVYKFLLVAIDNTTQTSAAVIINLRTFLDCDQSARFSLSSNISVPAVFGLPCQISDTDGLDIHFVERSKHLKASKVLRKNFLGIHINSPVPIGIDTDYTAVDIIGLRDNSRTVLSQIQIEFEITRKDLKII